MGVYCGRQCGHCCTNPTNVPPIEYRFSQGVDILEEETSPWLTDGGNELFFDTNFNNELSEPTPTLSKGFPGDGMDQVKRMKGGLDPPSILYRNSGSNLRQIDNYFEKNPDSTESWTQKSLMYPKSESTPEIAIARLRHQRS